MLDLLLVRLELLKETFSVIESFTQKALWACVWVFCTRRSSQSQHVLWSNLQLCTRLKHLLSCKTIMLFSRAESKVTWFIASSSCVIQLLRCSRAKSKGCLVFVAFAWVSLRRCTSCVHFVKWVLCYFLSGIRFDFPCMFCRLRHRSPLLHKPHAATVQLQLDDPKARTRIRANKRWRISCIFFKPLSIYAELRELSSSVLEASCENAFEMSLDIQSFSKL